jgi:hypothetical protein
MNTTQHMRGPFEAENVGLVASIYDRDFESKLEGLVEEVLQREGVIDRGRGDHVVIPAGELVAECDDQRCYYSTGFEVFDHSGRRIVMIGRAAGSMIQRTEDAFEILDLEVALAPT